MTDQAKNDAQPVIDAVVVGDVQRLLRALRGLAKALLLGVVEEGDGKKDSLVDESVEVGAGSDEVEGES